MSVIKAEHRWCRLVAGGAGRVGAVGDDELVKEAGSSQRLAAFVMTHRF
ncbi:hypothetical protein [Paraburkholderia phymatum]|nr:hypothetical protein [Paraburkholderia phymatum]